MSVTKFAASKMSTTNTTARRRHAAIASASIIEKLENRQFLSATLTLVNPDALPSSNRLIFNYVQNPDTTVPNVEHSQQTLQITDTGTDPLTINSMTLSGPWAFVGAPARNYAGTVVQPGTPLTITLAFTQRTVPAHSFNETNFTTDPNGGAAITGALTINSNDSTSSSKVVTLAGYWQNQSNTNNEPSLQTVVNLLAGYQTNINSTPIPDLTEPINPTASKIYGNEVVGNSWEAADPATPVSMQELATFRTQGNASTIYWYGAAQQQSHQLLSIPGNEGQTLLPTLADGSFATASFTPGGAFGLRDDIEYSTDSLNTAAHNPGGGGHHFRFFPLVDSSGKAVANTYIVALDYGIQQVENFDFNDHVFVVSNIRPSGTPETPTGFTASNAAQPVLTWNADTYAPVVYNDSTCANASGPFILLTTTAGTTYTDVSNPVGAVYYQLTATDNTQAPVTTSSPATAFVNTGPVLSPQTLNTYSGVAVTFDPLADATDSTGTLNPATVVVSVPNHAGTATVNTSSGAITYTPTNSFTGTETFTVTVTDSNGRTSAPVTVTAKVLSVLLEPPVAKNEVTTTLENTPIDIPVLNVDIATTTFNTSSIMITTIPTSGSVVANADGTVSYTPSTNFVGGDEFQYTVMDNNGQTSGIAIVDINVGAEISSAKNAAHSLLYTDQNGTPVTITLNKGVADVYFDGIGTVVGTVKGKTTVAGSNLRARQITLSGTTAASSLSITGKNKGQVNLGGVSDTGALGAINAPTTNLSAVGNSNPLGGSSQFTGKLFAAANVVAAPISPAGTVKLAGVKSVTLRTANSATFIFGGTGVTKTSLIVNGSVTDTSLTSAVPMSNLKAHSWNNTNQTQASENVTITAPSVANLVVTGEFDATLTVNSAGKAPALGNAKITGPVALSNWSVTGNANSIKLGAAALSWGGLHVSGRLASMTVGGNLASDITAGTINSLKVTGAISSNITTTGNLQLLQAGQLVNALVDVGSTASSIATATLGNLGSATLGTLRVTSKAANSFNDSSVIADKINSATTGPVNAANGGSPEGLAAHIIKGATVTVDNGILHLSGKDLLSNAALAAFLTTKGATLGTFTIDIL